MAYSHLLAEQNGEKSLTVPSIKEKVFFTHVNPFIEPEQAYEAPISCPLQLQQCPTGITVRKSKKKKKKKGAIKEQFFVTRSRAKDYY